LKPPCHSFFKLISTRRLFFAYFVTAHLATESKKWVIASNLNGTGIMHKKYEKSEKKLEKQLRIATMPKIAVQATVN